MTYLYAKLFVKDVKAIIPFNYHIVEVFKSRDKVCMWIKDRNYEDFIIKYLEKHNIVCFNHMIPSNGFYDLERLIL